MTRLLIEAARRGIHREYALQILAVLESPATAGGGAVSTGAPAGMAAQTSVAASPETGERLSERELEVVRLIARGASNREIADRLVVTVGTVKSHVNHILGKLAAHNRTEAVARARELRLLDI